MSSLVAPSSFESVWYWALTVVVWSVVCNHILGVPYDMLWRARRRPRVAAQATALAEMTAERVRLVHDRFGTAVAAIAGFGLAALGVIAFGYRIEPAAAAFCLLFPLSVVAYSTLRLALAMRQCGIRGPQLLRALARRRLWHQFIAVIALMATVATAFLHHPPY